MRKTKYKMYWCGYNWYTAHHDKQLRRNGCIMDSDILPMRLKLERMRNNISQWMLRNPMVLI